MNLLRSVIAGALLLIASGCPSESDGAEDAGSHVIDAAGDDIAASDITPDAPDGGLTPARVFEQHAALFDAVLAYFWEPGRIVDGNWEDDFGDAAMFGPSFDLRWWHHTGDEAYLGRAIAALDYDLSVVESAVDNPIELTNDMETVAMAGLALLEAGLFLDDERYHLAAIQLIDIFDTVAIGFDDYLEVSVGRFAANTYGPTAISTFVALLHLEHLLVYPDHEADSHLTRAQEILDHIHERAWSDILAAYRFEPDNDDLYLYPNATMMLASAAAAELTDEPRHMERFAAAFAGIQPLKDADGDHYHSPYSAAYMGAQDDDYTTLSSQNYLMLGLQRAYSLTGEAQYLQEIDTIVGFLADRLLSGGQILHHWMNGGPAVPTDPEYYCSGCNLQTLYLLALLVVPAPG